MSASVDFLDTNVIVYSLDLAAPEAKRRVSIGIVARALSEGSAVISWQIVQETLHVAAHKFKKAITDADRAALLREVLEPLWTIHPSASLYRNALRIQADRGFALYDSLIVAAAQEAGCKRLLTEDLQHGQRIGSLRIENPFLD
jgi:predicted nucleic acid-binding protein